MVVFCLFCFLRRWGPYLLADRSGTNLTAASSSWWNPVVPVPLVIATVVEPELEFGCEWV